MLIRCFLCARWWLIGAGWSLLTQVIVGIVISATRIDQSHLSAGSSVSDDSSVLASWLISAEMVQ